MIVDSALYQNGLRVQGPEDISDLVDKAKNEGGFVWLGLSAPSQEEFEMVVGELNFHPLAVEDAVTAMQRPKLEDYDGLTFFVIKTVFFDATESEITTGEVLCFITDHFIVTVRHGEGSPLTSVRADLEDKPNLLKHGPYAVLHAVVDRVIDGYTAIAAALEREVAGLEGNVFSGTRQTFSQDIYFLKREFVEFRHAIEPLLFPVQRIASETFSPVPSELKPFFRDTLDHLQKACDNASGLDSLLSAVLQADLAHVQVQQNIDVRKISAYVALAAGPTMIAGIYGMNFQHMPELETQYGYPIVIGIMITLTAFLVRKFKKSRWL
ncbi:MAG: magnesium and cobalt transport protein CorA [Actinobacteria bacterium]|nr:magnesium and cobalt transport protein CorA [Actinomycetota bacterium]